MKRILAACCVVCVVTTASALAPANPYGWDERQPDGSAAGRLYLKGHPAFDEEVLVVDQHDHPVVVDSDGWYVYGSPDATNSTTTTVSLRGARRRSPATKNTTEHNNRRRSLWHPTQYRISPDSTPPRHLTQAAVTAKSFPSVPSQVSDFLCQGQGPSPWCPGNERLIGRNSKPPSTKGTTKVLVILVRFSDHANRNLPTKQDFEFLFNGQGTSDSRAPTGTMQDFFRLQSLNQFNIDAHVEDWITVGETEEYYSFNNYGLTNLFAQVAYDTLDRMDRTPGMDWNRFDEDEDGVLDSVVILHSGFVAEGGGRDCYNEKEHGVHRIWSHATSVPDNQDTWYASDRSVRIGRYCTTSALFGVDCDAGIQRVGVIGHELLHTLGLPDMLGKPGTGVGIYDVMGKQSRDVFVCRRKVSVLYSHLYPSHYTSGMMWGPDGSLYYPSTLSPWCREHLGWVTPQRITTSGEYGIITAQYPSATREPAYRIDLSPDGKEYLLIENRQKRFMDAILPGDGGLLIWHIDDNMGTAWMSRPGWPLQDQWPGNGNHYTVALLSPDTRYDLERDANYGDEDDFWVNGFSLEPGPGANEAQVSQLRMYPNTDSYGRGIIKRTDIRIYDISEPGDYMTFKVEIPGTSYVPLPDRFSVDDEPTDPPTESPTFGPTESPTDPPPTESPTDSPTRSPSDPPTRGPTDPPTRPPTDVPTVSPTFSSMPSTTPSREPSEKPSSTPSNTPTDAPQGPYAYEEKKNVIRRPFEYYFPNR